jgi:hypothetical protein
MQTATETHTHYGRGIAPTGTEAVEAVVEAWRTASADGTRPVWLVVDEDAAWTADVEAAEADGWCGAGLPAAATPAEAVERWWEGYGGSATPEDGPEGWLEAVRAAGHPGAEWWA